MLLGNVTCCEKWCPHCKHKTEDILCTFIETHYSSVQRQFSADWCKNKRFDVAVHELCVIIELDGPQHIDKQIKNWGTPDENRAKDIYKMKCANDNGYSVVRILQEDVLCDTYDWKTELMNVLHEYPFITNVYLCKNNEYSGHEELYKQETLILTKQEDES
jgi:very-short-patch-repair endonuclease